MKPRSLLSSTAMVVLMMLSWSARAQTCLESPSGDSIVERLDVAQQAFADFDVEGFNETMDSLALSLPCASEVLQPPLIARYHWLSGLRQFVATNDQRAASAFAASRWTLEGVAIPYDTVPEGHEVHKLFGRVPLENGTFALAPQPVQGAIRFDGKQTLQRPTAWPTLVQLTGEDGAVTETQYLLPNEPLPSYEGEVPARGLVGAIGFVRSRRQLHFWGASALSVVGSGVLYGLASVSAASFQQDHPDYDLDDLKAHRTRTNAMVAGSAGLFAVAVGTGVLGAMEPSP